jgi:RNA polymerase sigma-70 factor (ECF subfamily)
MASAACDPMDVDKLLDRVLAGESSAAAALLGDHRERLKRMVSFRIDPRIAPRVDPSDVVQEALAEAHRRLPEYAKTRAIPFYPWLRRIAWDRLLQCHRQHIQAKRRTVLREDFVPLTDESEALLAERIAVGSTPSARALQQEIEQRIRHAIAELPDGDREVIVLKHLEELSFEEAAAVLEVSVAALYSRYYRAVQKLHKMLNRE